MSRKQILGGITAALGVAAWAAIGALGGVDLTWPPLLGRELPSLLLPLPGVLAGAGLVFALSGNEGTDPSKAFPPLAAALIGALLSILAWSLVAGKISTLQAVAGVVFGGVTIAYSIYALETISRDDGISFKSHWGGLGGGLTGWRASSALAFTVLALIFSGLTVATMLSPLFKPAVAPPALGTAQSAAKAIPAQSKGMAR